MTRNFEWLTMDDGFQLYVRYWKNDEVKPRAIVQIVHGMAEHIERYDDFAQFLLQNNIFVYGDDHRGHGKTGEKQGIFGFFSESNGFDRVVQDLHHVSTYIKNKHHNVPIILLGHSLGSFFTRRYIQKYSNEIQGVILSGTAGNPGLGLIAGKSMAQIEIQRVGKRKPSPLMDRIVFGSYNKGIEHVKFKFSWLSRDEKVVEEYVNDPYCAFICTPSFFYDMFTGLQLIHKPDNIKKIMRNLPILFISGDKDPVGAFAVGVKKAIHQYRALGLTNIREIFYKNARHEVLNEMNKEEVYRDIFQWLDQILE